MNKIIKNFGQSSSCQEVYELEVMVQVKETDGPLSLMQLQREVEDFQYEFIQDGYVHAIMRGQFLTLKRKISDLLDKGWRGTNI